jgi:glycogen operon protein
VGNFPPQWTEWNGKYRDTVRDFWRGHPSTLGEFASRITGSADLYEQTGRRPVASINFVTAHDGFTLRDLVSYDEKHNDANGEGGADGESHNRSWNSGAEGETDDPDIRALRARRQRDLLATLLLSQGVPMIAHGDELGRTQQGNNNVYAQDSELSWVDWEQADASLIEFTAALAGLRRDHPTFRRRRFLEGDPVDEAPDARPDIAWLRPDGQRMRQEDWHTDFGKSIGMYLGGEAIPGRDIRGERIVDDDFLVYFSSHDGDVEAVLPDLGPAAWTVLVDTSGAAVNSTLRTGVSLSLAPFSMVVLTEFTAEEEAGDDAVSSALTAAASGRAPAAVDPELA